MARCVFQFLRSSCTGTDLVVETHRIIGGMVEFTFWVFDSPLNAKFRIYFAKCDRPRTYIQIIIHIMKMDIGQSKIETRLNFRCWVMFDNLVLLICDGQAEWRICLFGSKCVSSVSWKCRRLFELYNSIDPWLPLHPIQTWYFELKGNNGLSSEQKQKWQAQNKSDRLTAI